MKKKVHKNPKTQGQLPQNGTGNTPKPLLAVAGTLLFEPKTQTKGQLPNIPAPAPAKKNVIVDAYWKMHVHDVFNLYAQCGNETHPEIDSKRLLVDIIGYKIFNDIIPKDIDFTNAIEVRDKAYSDMTTMKQGNNFHNNDDYDIYSKRMDLASHEIICAIVKQYTSNQQIHPNPKTLPFLTKLYDAAPDKRRPYIKALRALKTKLRAVQKKPSTKMEESADAQEDREYD